VKAVAMVLMMFAFVVLWAVGFVADALGVGGADGEDTDEPPPRDQTT
jgi:hypothetical protein